MLTGQVIGAYTLESLIGAGAMGQVWRATRSDGRFQANAAVKLLNFTLADTATGRARFRHEAGVLALLNHPNVARLLDAGVSEAGQPYLILEYVDGVPVDRYCKERRVTVQECIQLGLQILEAVGHAHANLIVHRDIKPANILVTADGTPKLLDFGIARLLQDDPLGVRLTRNTAALSLGCAAPEQLTGSAITTATDIYAVGALLYLLLSGRYLCNLTASQPLPIAGNSDLDIILAKALKNDPGARYSSTADFADDLTRCLSHEPISARRDSWSYRAWKMVQRHPVSVVAVVLAVAAVSAGTVGTATQAYRAQQERDRAVRHLTDAEATTEFLGSLVTELANTRFTRGQLLEQAERSVVKEFAAEAEIRARLQLVIAEHYMYLGDLSHGQQVLAAAQASAEGVSDTALRTYIACDVAGLDDQMGNGKAAEAIVASIEPVLRSSTELDPLTLGLCHSNLAVIYRDRHDVEPALRHALAGVAMLGSSHLGQGNQWIDSRQILADSYAVAGRRPETIETYRRMFDELRSLGKENTGYVVTLLSNYASQLNRAGLVLQASKVYDQLRPTEAPQGPTVLNYIESNYAAALVLIGRKQEAAELAEHALAEERKGSRNARALGWIELVAANTWLVCGDRQRGEAHLQEARKSVPEAYPPHNHVRALLERVNSQYALARRDPAAARQHLLAAVDIYDKDAGRVQIMADLVDVDLLVGDLADATHWAEAAIGAATEESKGFPHTRWLGLALLANGKVKRALGRHQEATHDLTQALTQLTASLGPVAPSTQDARSLLAD